MTYRCPNCGEQIPSNYSYHARCGWKGDSITKTAQYSNKHQPELIDTMAPGKPPSHKESTQGKIKSLKEILNDTEKIGSIGSPSSTSKLSIDILETAVKKKLVGEMAFFQFEQENRDHYALGQMTEIELKNVWLEGPTIRSLARIKGSVPPISGLQDTHLGDMQVSAVFSKQVHGFEPSLLGTVPPTGTLIKIVTDDFLESLLAAYQDQIFYLGHIYGSSPRLPMWFKHFDGGADGAGEAYHIGIFGKTGSGKSVLAKMILLAYAKHQDMGLFIIDPQGEFSIGLRKNGMPENMQDIFASSVLSKMGRGFKLYDLANIRMDRWGLFIELLLEFKFFFSMGIKDSNYQVDTSDYVKKLLKEKTRYTFKKLNDSTLIDVLNNIKENIHRVYSGVGSDRVKDFIGETLQAIDMKRDNPIKSIWEKVIKLFKPSDASKTPKEIVASVLSTFGRRPIVVIDLSKRPEDIGQGVWENKIKPLLIDCFLDELIRTGEREYHQEGKSLNTLVLIDEAHRLAPRERLDNETSHKIKKRLVDAVRTTRKYGLGWMFLSQTLSSLDKEIIGQLRISFYGFGLTAGSEFMSVKEIVGGDSSSIKLYQSFRDPHSALNVSSRQYNFMTHGPVSPLSFAGTPLFLSAFNTPEAFLRINKLT